MAADYSENIAKLRSILGAGEGKVRLSDGREVTFHTPAEILRSISYFEGEQTVGTASERPGTTLASFRKC